jgi:peptide deformylase
MVLPIVAYGHSTLRKRSKDIDKDYPELDKLLEDMFETMYVTKGVGLAAPQINRNIRLFIIDADPFKETYPEAEGAKMVLINPRILKEEGEEWSFEEGCLSVPDIHEAVMRKPRILIEYYDEKWQKHNEWHEGVIARIMQHEYDHIEGKIFIEKLSSVRRIMLKKKLNNISTGAIEARYKMIYPQLKKHRK